MQVEPRVGLEAMTQAEAYPHDPSVQRGVRHVETHISHLILHTDRGDWDRELHDGLGRLLAPLASRISHNGINPE